MTTISAVVRMPQHADPLTEPIAVPSTALTAEDWQREEDKVFIGCARSAAIAVLFGIFFVGLFNWELDTFPVVVSFGGLAISLLAALAGLIGTVGANTNARVTTRGIFCYAMAIVGVATALPAIYQVILALAAR